MSVCFEYLRFKLISFYLLTNLAIKAYSDLSFPRVEVKTIAPLIQLECHNDSWYSWIPHHKKNFTEFWFSDIFDTYLKSCGHGFKSFNLRVLKCRVGGDGVKHFQDLAKAPLECVKLPKDVHFTNVKLSLRSRLFQLLLGFMKTPLVLLSNKVWNKTNPRSSNKCKWVGWLNTEVNNKWTTTFKKPYMATQEIQ